MSKFIFDRILDRIYFHVHVRISPEQGFLTYYKENGERLNVFA